MRAGESASFFALLADRIAESSDFPAEFEIFAVRERRKPAAVEAEFAGLVYVLLVHVYRDDVGKKHIVRTERHNVGYFALKAHGALLYHRAGDFCRLFGPKAGYGELVKIPARTHAAEIGGFYKPGRCEVDDKFAGFFD